MKKVTKKLKEVRPRGTPVSMSYMDRQDADILQRLAEMGKCQQRLRVDHGRHYIFCGGYYDLKAVHTDHGLRCIFHRGL